VSVFGSGGKMAVFLLWRESFIKTGKKRYSRLSGGLSCCVSFWFWREIGSFFVVVGKFYYDRKKKIQLSVWRVRDHYYDRKKKRYSRLSGGCAIIITTGKKKDTVVCLAGCAVVSVFGSGGKLAVLLLWRESFITT
jgi:hypothetical protein